MIVKRKGKYCVVGHKKSKDGKHRNFGCYKSKAEAKKRLGEIFMFKHRKALLLNIMTTASDRLERKGIIHMADVIDKCAEEIATDNAGEPTALKIMKVVNLLERRGEFELAEQLDAVIPEILDKSIDEE